MKFTILGCGSSGGVPRIGGHWGACNPANPKNRRQRCSLMVERVNREKLTRVLIDTSPDMRNQLLAHGAAWLDGVLYTHEHADHIHGVDDLRMVALNGRRRVDIHADARTLAMLQRRFGYCFETPAGSGYPPILQAHEIEAFEPVRIDGPGGAVEALPFSQDHGDIISLGYRFGALAYSSDLVGIPDESIEALQGLDVWIVDALRYTPHPTHFSLEETLEWIERLKPKRAILTNMHVDLDYATLKSELPGNVVPAYDGMTIEM